MKISKAYENFVRQLNDPNLSKLEGYNENLFNEIYDSEIEEAEDLIWDTFYNKHDINILVLFPKLKKYDGISALKNIVLSYSIPSSANMLISYLIYQNTQDIGYLELMERNIIESQYDYSYVSMLIYSAPCEDVYKVLVRIYVNCSNRIALSSSINGILYNKGFIKNLDEVKQVSNMKELRNILKNAPFNEREKMIEKLEKGKFDKYKWIELAEKKELL